MNSYLPNGKYAKDSKQFHRVWNKWIKEFEEATGMTIMGFDTRNISCHEKKDMSKIVQIPFWFADKIKKRYRRLSICFKDLTEIR